MEAIRRKMMQDPNVYPEYGASGGPSKSREQNKPRESDVISIESSSDEEAEEEEEEEESQVSAPRQRLRETVIISSDEEESESESGHTSGSGAVVAAAPSKRPIQHRRIVDSDSDDENASSVEIVASHANVPPRQPEVLKPPTSNDVQQQEQTRHRFTDSIKKKFHDHTEEITDSIKKKLHLAPAVPIHIPSNKDLSSQKQYGMPEPQPYRATPASIQMPIPQPYRAADIRPTFSTDTEDRGDDGPTLSPAEAEKALRDLIGGGMNTDIAEDEIDMKDAIVPGFRDGIVLLPHQVLGRHWMKSREDPSLKRTGGILADDMGLGKTIQTVNRIVEGRARKSDKADGYAATTLVVCPLALLAQWAAEIKKMAVGLTVLEHHGPSRTSSPNVLKQNHVVITTYDVVKSEYAKWNPNIKDETSTAKSKGKSKAKGGSSDVESDESAENFGRTLASKKPATKVIAVKDALFHVKWFRIVLDEAHNIKNRTTKAAIACCELQAKFRWCLTGTPIQNDVAELYPLLNFLRIKPLNDWSIFNAQIAKPVKSGKGATRAMKRLHVVLKQVMLRRRKTDTLNGEVLIKLPPRNVDIIACEFDSSERAFYSSLETKMTEIVEKLLAEDGKANYTSVLLLLLRLRQACLHPVLVQKDYKTDLEAVEPQAAKKDSPSQSQGLDDDADDLVAAMGQLGVTRQCQLCQTELSSRNSNPDESRCIDCSQISTSADEHTSSAKIRMILQIIKDVETRSEKTEKTIIFSQFTSMLNLIEPFLDQHKIKYVRYDGSMKKKDREASLETIRTSTSTRCILISFKAGSTGLNLTSCNNVILVDMWWNPALEDQAFDRAHRFGQTRPVNIFKLKIDDTVEDRILALQETKRALAAAALSGDKVNARLGLDDLLALFRPGGRDEDEED